MSAHRRRIGTPLTLAALAAALLGHPAGAQEADTLLARARAAIGSWSATPVSLEGRGTAHASGAEGELLWRCAPDGSFRLELDSALPRCAGWDGHTAWGRDQTGLARTLELQEADHEKLFAWVLSSHWLDAPEVEVRADDTGSRLLLTLAGTPMEMSLTLDPESGLPAVLEERTDSAGARWTFSDFSPVEGRRLAHAWTFVEGDVPGLEEDRWRIASYARLQGDAAGFGPELDQPADVHYDPAAAAELEVERLPSGHLLVWPLLEGESFGAFVFDTGAGITVIDRGVADELLLETLGHTTAVGVAGVTTSSFRRGERFQLGPVTIENPIYGDLDLGFIGTAMGRKVAGIVGYDLLARCVAEIEPEKARIALHDPQGYRLEGGSWQDLVLHQNHACVRARFEGAREGLFRLDTGAGGTVTFHAPAVEALGLLEGREVTSAHSGGVGGGAAAPIGELAWFELGGHRFEHPRVAFSQATSGAFTDVYTTGNIGQDFLRTFRLVLDYPHDRLALVELPQAH